MIMENIYISIFFSEGQNVWNYQYSTGQFFVKSCILFTQFYWLRPAQKPLIQEKSSHNPKSAIITSYFKVHWHIIVSHKTQTQNTCDVEGIMSELNRKSRYISFQFQKLHLSFLNVVRQEGHWIKKEKEPLRVCYTVQMRSLIKEYRNTNDY